MKQLKKYIKRYGWSIFYGITIGYLLAVSGFSGWALLFFAVIFLIQIILIVWAFDWRE